MRAVSSAAALASQRPRPIVIIMQPTWRTECSVKLAAVNMTRDRVLFPTPPEEKDGVILFILIICIPTLVSYIFASRRENLCLFLRNVTWCFAFHKSKMAALSQVKYSSDKGVGSGRGTHRYGRVKRMIMLIWSQLSGWHSDAGLAKFGGNLIVKMLRSGWPASAFY